MSAAAALRRVLDEVCHDAEYGTVTLNDLAELHMALDVHMSDVRTKIGGLADLIAANMAANIEDVPCGRISRERDVTWRWNRDDTSRSIADAVAKNVAVDRVTGETNPDRLLAARLGALDALNTVSWSGAKTTALRPLGVNADELRERTGERWRVKVLPAGHVGGDPR